MPEEEIKDIQDFQNDLNDSYFDDALDEIASDIELVIDKITTVIENLLNKINI